MTRLPAWLASIALITAACSGATATGATPAGEAVCAGRVAVAAEVAAILGLAGVREFLSQRGWLSAYPVVELVEADAKPTIVNARQVQLSMLRRYPPELRNAGIGGTTVLRVLVASTGRIRHAAVVSGSGYEQLDGVALESVREMRFSPLLQDGCAVPLVADVPVQLTAH